jgi:homoserine O-succinyltransferase/O-acetyltransferase
MVVNLDSSGFRHDRAAGSARPFRRTTQGQLRERTSRCVTIGLVNNMAGAAFKATERQFVSLLDVASVSIPIHLSFYTFPGLSPAESGGLRFAGHYASVEALLDTHLDGLIVTGREPKMANLRDEPYWESFTQVLEWARNNTHSAIWSCLAAHAAILQMDGIGRRRSEEKNFGVFECAQVSDHPLMRGLSSQFNVPQSRWNDVAEKDLTDLGYSVLSRIAGNGVDAFVKQEKSMFVFFQGHFEYQSHTLMREYRRDLGRYVKGETDTYPPLPRRYFDCSTEKVLTTLRDKAVSCRSAGVLTSVAAALETAKIENTWQRSAACIYKNWLECICARKSESKGKHPAVASLTM